LNRDVRFCQPVGVLAAGGNQQIDLPIIEHRIIPDAKQPDGQIGAAAAVARIKGIIYAAGIMENGEEGNHLTISFRLLGQVQPIDKHPTPVAQPVGAAWLKLILSRNQRQKIFKHGLWPSAPSIAPILHNQPDAVLHPGLQPQIGAATTGSAHPGC
jgi:hypothetical protein